MKGTKIIMMRHAEHLKNELTKDGKKRAQKAGELLLEAGLVPDRLVTSPQQRCIQTVECVCKGAGVVYNPDELLIFNEFGSAVDGPHAFTADEIDALKTQSSALKRSVEAQILMSNDLGLIEKMIARGKEGAEKILELTGLFPNETILVSTHAGSRIEPVLAHLLKIEYSILSPFKPCGITTFRFEADRIESLGFISVTL